MARDKNRAANTLRVVETDEDSQAAIRQLNRAQDHCLAGATVLAFLAHNEGQRTDEIVEIEQSFVSNRLTSCGMELSDDTVAAMNRMVARLDPTANDLMEAASGLSCDLQNFTLVFHTALLMARRQRAMSAHAYQTILKDSPTIAILREVGRSKGWL